HLLGSGPILNYALKAQEILAEQFQVEADVWSVTSYKELRRDALACERWNLLHPAESPRTSYVEDLLAEEEGVFVAASDYLLAALYRLSRTGAIEPAKVQRAMGKLGINPEKLDPLRA